MIKISIPIIEKMGDFSTQLKKIQTTKNTRSTSPIKINRFPDKVQVYLDRIFDK